MKITTPSESNKSIPPTTMPLALCQRAIQLPDVEEYSPRLPTHSFREPDNVSSLFKRHMLFHPHLLNNKNEHPLQGHFNAYLMRHYWNTHQTPAQTHIKDIFLFPPSLILKSYWIGEMFFSSSTRLIPSCYFSAGFCRRQHL